MHWRGPHMEKCYVLSLFSLAARPSSPAFLFDFLQYMTAAAPMQGTYIPQYTPVPPTAVSIEVSLSLLTKRG